MKNMIKAIIVDDNKGAISLLKNMLKEYCPNVEIVKTFESSSQALKAVNFELIKPELLFLDIQMDNDEINGLELFRLIQMVDTNTCNAIFVTAHNKFMLQALRLNALDFLTKPINKVELINAVEKQKNQQSLKERINGALEFSKKSITAETKIAIRVGNKISFIRLFDICYCKSNGNYAQVYTTDGKKTLVNYSLKELGEILPESHFFRCHNEFIINGLHVKEFNNTVRGSLIILVNKEQKEIPVSRSRKDELADFLKRFSLNDDIF